MQTKEYILPNGKIAAFQYDITGVGKVTLECMDELMAMIADRPQGEWIDKGRNLWGCSNCGMEIYSESEQDRNEFHKWCSRCGARMKGADDSYGEREGE